MKHNACTPNAKRLQEPWIQHGNTNRLGNWRNRQGAWNPRHERRELPYGVCPSSDQAYVKHSSRSIYTTSTPQVERGCSDGSLSPPMPPRYSHPWGNSAFLEIRIVIFPRNGQRNPTTIAWPPTRNSKEKRTNAGGALQIKSTPTGNQQKAGARH